MSEEKKVPLPTKALEDELVERRVEDLSFLAGIGTSEAVKSDSGIDQLGYNLAFFGPDRRH